MALSIGEKIIFPSHGPCLIDAVVHKFFGATSMKFYQLTRLEENGGQLFIPVNRIRQVGIRRLLQRSEIPKLLSRLSHSRKAILTSATEGNWKRRAFDWAKLLASGTAMDLVKVVESLTDLSAGRALGTWDRQTLDRAKRLLVSEIAEVLGEPRSAVSERVDTALNLRRAK